MYVIGTLELMRNMKFNIGHSAFLVEHCNTAVLAFPWICHWPSIVH